MRCELSCLHCHGHSLLLLSYLRSIIGKNSYCYAVDTLDQFSFILTVLSLSLDANLLSDLNSLFSVFWSRPWNRKGGQVAQAVYCDFGCFSFFFFSFLTSFIFFNKLHFLFFSAIFTLFNFLRRTFF